MGTCIQPYKLVSKSVYDQSIHLYWSWIWLILFTLPDFSIFSNNNKPSNTLWGILFSIEMFEKMPTFALSFGVNFLSQLCPVLFVQFPEDMELIWLKPRLQLRQWSCIYQFLDLVLVIYLDYAPNMWSRKPNEFSDYCINVHGLLFYIWSSQLQTRAVNNAVMGSDEKTIVSRLFSTN